ncbi:MAG: hypothetical protein JWP87_2050 [Labilithrix sp.]|nr:hypothetical protein [Labilithrix sp.]
MTYVAHSDPNPTPTPSVNMRTPIALGLLVCVAACSSTNEPSAASPDGSSGLQPPPAGTPTDLPDAGGVDSSTPAPTCAEKFGTYLRPYAVDSPWNTRPVKPVLGTATIPDSINGWRPVISDGVGFSTGVFLASATDPPITLKGTPTINDKDVETPLQTLVLPHWPANVVPATESDGHADIIDPTTKMVHSFNGMKKRPDGSWEVRDYGWSKLDGRGWGDPAHYFQGARAVGVPASAGIIRKHEFLSTDPVYRHALSLSLPHNAIKKGDGTAPTAIVYPATQGDSEDPSAANSGQIPEGALLMLPADFDSAKMPTPELVRIAETLKTYGAYVTDRNFATPYNIYVEIGTGYSLGKSDAIDAALATVQHALRPLASEAGWLDGCDQPAVRVPKIELQSMRGKWSLGASVGWAVDDSLYSTWQQGVAFKGPGITYVSGWNNDRVIWGKRVAGKPYRLFAEATGGGTLRYQVMCDAPNDGNKVDSGVLKDGEKFDFVWPVGACNPFLSVTSGNATSVVRARMQDN